MIYHLCYNLIDQGHPERIFYRLCEGQATKSDTMLRSKSPERSEGCGTRALARSDTGVSAVPTTLMIHDDFRRQIFNVSPPLMPFPLFL